MTPWQFIAGIHRQDLARPQARWVSVFTIPDRSVYWYRIDGPSADADLQRLSQNSDVYFSCGLHSRRQTAGQRGSEADIAELPGLWLDVDVEGEQHKLQGYFPSKAEASAWLQSLPLKPTVVVDSGYGLQAWWQFDRPLEVSQYQWGQAQGHRAARQLSRRWQAKLQEICPYALDTTSDLARVLRPVGTFNHKGEVPKPVRLVSGEYQTYAVEHLSGLLQAPEAVQGQATVSVPEGPVTSALSVIEPHDRETWLKVGMALHQWGKGSAEARALWDSWSLSQGYRPDDMETWQKEQDKVWNSFHGTEDGITIATVLSMAAQRGWIDPEEEAFRQRQNERVAQKQGKQAVATTPTFTDLHRADVLIDQMGRDLIYCPEVGWLQWSGLVWRKDITDGLKATSALSRRLSEEKNDDIALSLSRDYADVVSAGRAIRYAAADQRIRVETEQLDAAEKWLPVTNGYVNLETGELTDSSEHRDKLLTRSVDLAYQPGKVSELWEQSILEIMGGSEEMVRFLQKLAGYSLTGSTVEEKLFIHQGGGSNGKSTFIDALLEVSGEYGKTAPFDSFVKRRGGGIPNDIAAMRGSRVVIASEPSDGVVLDEGKIKQLTGGDKVAARFLHREFFTFRPRFKLHLMTNPKPQISGTDDGIWRRVVMIPYRQRFAVSDLKARILRYELPGVLAWAVRGAVAWYKEGLHYPGEVRSATSEYRAEENPLGEWIDVHLQPSDRGMVPLEQATQSYVSWCMKQGLRYVDRKDFMRALEKAGYHIGRASGRGSARVVQGASLQG